ncbi:MAG TPA: IS200/IS605 family transposase [Pyrinomonadaceae bacterium]|nr:IS200/IS605 family transposase [Pyrinomonadaceae bacterium]
MHLDPLTTLSWAYQLHYYLCFRTRSRHAISNLQLSDVLEEVSNRHDYHLLKSQQYPDHVRLLMSLRPVHRISDVILKLKANSSRELNLGDGFWQRGYLAKSVGRVRIDNVKAYIAEQSEHHGYANRLLPPVYRYRAEHQAKLRASHASFELTHHLVFATRNRVGVFDSTLGEKLTTYWLRVATLRGFAIDRVTIVPDHSHLLVRTAPKLGIEACALSLLNNGQYFIGKNYPEALVRAGIHSLWQPSAYAGTTGSYTTALVKKFLSEQVVG